MTRRHSVKFITNDGICLLSLCVDQEPDGRRENVSALKGFEPMRYPILIRFQPITYLS